MGYAARANRARRLIALQNGTAADDGGIVLKIRPNGTASRGVVGIRMARLLGAMLALTSTPSGPRSMDWPTQEADR